MGAGSRAARRASDPRPLPELEDTWKPEAFHDEFREKLEQVVEQKVKMLVRDTRNDQRSEILSSEFQSVADTVKM